VEGNILSSKQNKSISGDLQLEYCYSDIRIRKDGICNERGLVGLDITAFEGLDFLK